MFIILVRTFTFIGLFQTFAFAGKSIYFIEIFGFVCLPYKVARTDFVFRPKLRVASLSKQTMNDEDMSAVEGELINIDLCGGLG